MIDESDTIVVTAADLREGDCVDLESCPHLHDEPIAEFEYAEVIEIGSENGLVVVGYNGCGASYQPTQKLTIKRRQ